MAPVLYWIEVRRGSRLQVLQLLEGGAGDSFVGSEEMDQALSLGLGLETASGRNLSKRLLLSSILRYFKK